MDRWSLQDAKNKLSQVVNQALSRPGPQIITRHGKNTAVLISYQHYLELSGEKASLLNRLLPDEPIDFELDVRRNSHDVGREIDL